MTTKGYKAVVIMCESRMEGIVFRESLTEDIKKLTPTFVFNAQQLRSIIVDNDILLLRTDGYKRSPGMPDMEHELKYRIRRPLITFVNVDGVCYPVTEACIHHAEYEQKPVLFVTADLVYGFKVHLSADSITMYNGIQTIFIQGGGITKVE